MAKVERFEDLEIWKKAMDIGVEVYMICDATKIKTDYGLKDQLRNALLSISNNISEGFEYGNNKDFIRFLRFAKGSAGEVRNVLHFTHRIGYIDQ